VGIEDINVIAACTIVSKNYLPFARTLADSYIRHHKGAMVFVLLIDKADGYFDPSKEKFQLIKLDELDNIENKEQILFKYNIIEFSTAVKPFFIEYIFKHHPVKQLLYFDPDILITNPLNKIQNLLNTYSIVVIPHITSPISISDKELPNEITFLQCGAYNLGFIGLSKTEETLRFIQWWKERLLHYCLHDVQNGLFVDQKWIDMVPALFDGVFILKEPGYNVAYWNLQEKNFSDRNDKLMVNDMPLYFFHFSGLEVDRIESISKYLTRYRLSDFKELRRLFELYKELLIKNSYHVAKIWPYSYGFFDNSKRIRDIDRRKYWAMGEKVAKFGNPFETKGTRSFYEYLRRHRWKWTIHQKIISNIIPTGLKYKEQIRKLPFICSIAKEFYQKILLSRYKERVTYNNLGMEDHDFIYNNDRFGTTSVAKGDYGINLAGYLDAESGVGESARCLIKVIQSANIPFVLNNVEQPWIRRDDKTHSSLFSERNPHSINLLHVNADQTPYVAKALGQGYFPSKYNIGYWYWEASKFPYLEWKKSFDYFNEIWVASNFCLEAISRVSHIPVVKIPPSVSVDIQGVYSKEFFGIRPDSYAFLFMFDFLSFIERKNPFSIIDAFNLSYRNFDMRNAMLVIKCSNSDKNPKEYKRLLNSVKGLPVLIINKYFANDELHGLLNISDCYVSLHRAEGFGFPIAKAMNFGKPVIVTAYSGNMDFTNNKNSYLVNYDLVEIKSDIGPYKKGYEWAEPDIDHAASLMFKAYKYREESTKIGQEAVKYIKRHYSPGVLAKRLVKRVELIRKIMA